MQIDVILTDKEIEQAIYDYCLIKGVVSCSFKLIKKYPTLNSYTFSDVKEDTDEVNQKITTEK